MTKDLETELLEIKSQLRPHPPATNSSEKKFDGGKIKASLLYENLAQELEAVAAILQYGNEKYAGGEGWDTGWQRVEEAYDRYMDAFHRHQIAYAKGEVYDPEHGITHRAAMVINQLFLMWFDRVEGEQPHINPNHKNVLLEHEG